MLFTAQRQTVNLPEITAQKTLAQTMMVDYITATWLFNPINLRHTHTSKSKHAL